jgi:hypothetical protein
VRKDDLKRRVEPTLYQVMEPGDQIVGGTLTMTGSMTWDLMAGVPAIMAMVAGTAGLIGAANPSAGLAFAGLPPLALLPQLRRRLVFVAVTRQELIGYRMSRMGNKPDRLLFRAPLAAVRVTSAGRRAPGWRSFRYSGPGADGRGLQLNVQRQWRQDLDEVLGALQAGGAAVEGVPYRSQPPLLPMQ